MAEDINNKDIDLSGALKSSESDAKFRERGSYSFGTSKMVQWVVKYSGGLIKSQKQANYILLGFVALTVIVALFLIFSSVPKELPPAPKDSIQNNL